MKTRTKEWSLSVLGLLSAWLASPAHAAGAPLLVVVEAPANVNVDAEEVRRAIGNELGIETASPTRPASAAPDRTLVVAIGHDHIAMSLRAATGAPLVRTIDTPADHGERLRAIAWLAGNLVRDQVGPIIAAASVAAPPMEPSVTVTSPGAEASLQPPPAAAVPSTNATATPTISTRAPSDGPPQGWGWAVGAGWGSTIGVWGRGPTNVFGSYDAARGNAWHADVQSQLDGGEIILGLRIEGTTGSYNPQLFGALAFVGSAWPRRFFSVEATIGLGIERLQTLNYNFMPTTSPITGLDYTISPGRPHMVPYARLSFAIVVPVVNGVSALLSLGGHATGEFYDGWFGEGTLGLRYTFQ